MSGAEHCVTAAQQLQLQGTLLGTPCKGWRALKCKATPTKTTSSCSCTTTLPSQNCWVCMMHDVHLSLSLNRSWQPLTAQL